MSKSDESFQFHGFRSPRTTQTPDEIFDELLAPGLLTEAELRVLLYIVRRTFGFKKDTDPISLSQITDGIIKADGTRLDWGAGVGRPAAVRAAKSLEKKGIITIERSRSRARGNEINVYSLRMADDAPPQFSKETRVVSEENQGGIRRARSLVSQRNPQQTVQITVKQETDDSNRPALKKRAEPTTPRPPASSYIAAVIGDFSRELGDMEHSTANITQAHRLWQESGLGETDFVAQLQAARQATRRGQGMQGAGSLDNKMAYFFTALRRALGVEPALSRAKG